MQEKTGVISITLSSSNLSTRATEPGVNDLKENAINSIHYFLYASGQTGQNALKWGSFSDLSANGNTTVNVNVTEDELNNIFNPNTNKCEVFLIVNLPSSVKIDEKMTSLTDLEALALEADFKSKQDAFVMTGKDVVKIVDRKKIHAASGTINVDRVASKLTIHFDVNHSYTDDKGSKWVSQPKGMTVIFCNAISNALLSGKSDAVTTKKLFDYEFDESGNSLNVTYSDDSRTSFDCTTPFYSYPQTWDSGSPEQPYFFVSLPWKMEKEDATLFRNCFYKVYVNTTSLERNNWYHINLALNALGSFDNKEPVISLNLPYQVCDWNDFSFSTEIQDARYLVVDQNKYVMNNIPTLRIPFLSSHECKLDSVTVTRENLKDTGSDEPISSDDYRCEIISVTEADGTVKRYIEYSKKLDNDYKSGTFDFAPYKIKFKIQHNDDPSFVEKIEITQYPAIYAKNCRNSDYVTGGKNDQHNTLVNGYYGTGPNMESHYLNGQDYFGSCTGYFEDGKLESYSPGLFLFTVTSLQGTEYIIGDPRETEIDENLITASAVYNDDATTTWYKAPALYGESPRGLRYYYPTDGSEATKNMIAPVFRLASSYGVLYPGEDYSEASLSLEGMRKRCASYQEDGYPAGRWRLPTEAEFKFIISQVNRTNPRLPGLYVPGSSYWCAHGYATVNKDKTVTMHYEATGSGYSTRCVYDEWYWGSEQLKNRSQFTWGDMPRYPEKL